MNVRLEYDMQWRAAIWFENCLQMNRYNMELAITTNTSNADDHVVSLNRLNHFVYNEMANTVYIHQDDVSQIQALTAAGITVAVEEISVGLSDFNQKYLETKRTVMGHLMGKAK